MIEDAILLRKLFTNRFWESYLKLLERFGGEPVHCFVLLKIWGIIVCYGTADLPCECVNLLIWDTVFSTLLFLIPHGVVYLLSTFLSEVGSIDCLSVIVRDLRQFSGIRDGWAFLVNKSDELVALGIWNLNVLSDHLIFEWLSLRDL